MLDPRSSESSIDYVGLNPRLDTLAGKKIGITNHHGGNEQICETIATKLQALVPEADVAYHSCVGGWSWDRRKPEDSEFIQSCDAVVICQGY